MIDAATAGPAARWLAQAIAAGKPTDPSETWVHLSPEVWWVDAGHVHAAWRNDLGVPRCVIPARRLADALTAAGEEVLSIALDGKATLKGPRFKAVLPLVEPDYLPDPPMRLTLPKADPDLTGVLPALGAFAVVADEGNQRVTMTQDAAWVSGFSMSATVGPKPQMDAGTPLERFAVLPAAAMRHLPPDITHAAIGDRVITVRAEGGREMRIKGLEIGGSAYSPSKWFDGIPPEAPVAATFSGEVLADEMKRVTWAGQSVVAGSQKLDYTIGVHIADGLLRVRVADNEGNEARSETPLKHQGDVAFLVTDQVLSAAFAAAGGTPLVEAIIFPEVTILRITGDRMSVIAATVKVKERQT